MTNRLLPLFLAGWIGSCPFAYAVTLFASDTGGFRSPTHRLASLSLDDGATTITGNFGISGNMAGLAWDAINGVMYGTTTTTNSLYEVSVVTGAVRYIGDLGVTLIHGLAYDNIAQVLYGSFGESEGDGLYRIDILSGAATFVGNIGHFFNDRRQTVHGMTFHPETNVLYASIDGPTADGAIVEIDVSTGKGTLVVETRALHGISFHPETGILYGINNAPDELFTVDLETGEFTSVGRIDLENALGLEFGGFLIPEPSTSLLVLLSFGLSCGFRQRV